eukprot:1658198-Rhodomonas_salina.1
MALQLTAWHAPTQSSAACASDYTKDLHETWARSGDGFRRYFSRFFFFFWLRGLGAVQTAVDGLNVGAFAGKDGGDRVDFELGERVRRDARDERTRLVT